LIVFVSSTYLDLTSHRAVLEASLTMSGCIYNGMEHFAAVPTPTLDVCLDAVRKCDVFIGILGMQYGSCPYGRSLSYTEREYRQAYTLRKPLYIFLVDEQNARVRPMDVEIDPYKIERLRKFKERVLRRHQVARFTSENHLARLVLASLMHAEARLSGAIV